MHRREFIKSAGAAAFIMSLGQKLTFATTPGQIPYRVLGHTGEKVSLLGIGGYHIGQPFVSESTAVQIVRTAVDVMDAHFNSFGRGVLPVLAKKNIGILGMKTMGDKSILKSKTVTPVECLKFSMNLPLSVCITGCDSMEILHQALDVVMNFKPLTQEEVTAILAKTEAAAANGRYEPYKASAYIRGTEQHLRFDRFSLDRLRQRK